MVEECLALIWRHIEDPAVDIIEAHRVQTAIDPNTFAKCTHLKIFNERSTTVSRHINSNPGKGNTNPTQSKSRRILGQYCRLVLPEICAQFRIWLRKEDTDVSKLRTSFGCPEFDHAPIESRWTWTYFGPGAPISIHQLIWSCHHQWRRRSIARF